MTHETSIVSGYEHYDDCEFGPDGHPWVRALCSCGWKGPEIVHTTCVGDIRKEGAEVRAKSHAFDHLEKVNS